MSAPGRPEGEDRSAQHEGDPTSHPRVLLADDHPIFAQGLRSMLSPEFDLVGVVADGQAMVDAARRLGPDVIVADVSMPVMNGIEALETLRREGMDTPVVFLTMHNQPGYARRALRSGAAGYVLKLAAPEELVQAIRAALDGRTFVSPAMAHAMSDTAQRDGPEVGERIARLTQQQRTILRLLAEGLSAKEIGRKLDISPRTVESHKYQVMEVLGAQGSTELVRLAIRHGVIDP